MFLFFFISKLLDIKYILSLELLIIATRHYSIKTTRLALSEPLAYFLIILVLNIIKWGGKFLVLCFPKTTSVISRNAASASILLGTLSNVENVKTTTAKTALTSGRIEDPTARTAATPPPTKKGTAS